MEIEYELNPDDLFAFQWRAAHKSRMSRKAIRRAYVVWFLALLFMSSLPAIGEDGFSIDRVDFRFLVVALAVVAFLHWVLTRWLTSRAIRQLVNEHKNDKGQIGRHRVVLSERGVIESTSVGESLTLWAGIDRLEQDRDYIFIYTQPYAAHVIPKRAFSSVSEARSFYEFARVHKEANRLINTTIQTN